MSQRALHLGHHTPVSAQAPPTAEDRQHSPKCWLTLLQGWALVAASLLAQPQLGGGRLAPLPRWQLIAQLLALLRQALQPHWQVQVSLCMVDWSGDMHLGYGRAAAGAAAAGPAAAPAGPGQPRILTSSMRPAHGSPERCSPGLAAPGRRAACSGGTQLDWMVMHEHSVQHLQLWSLMIAQL